MDGELNTDNNGTSSKSRRKQVFTRERFEEVFDEEVAPKSLTDVSIFFEDFTEDVLDALLEENLEPPDEFTQAEIENTLDLIRLKHPHEFGAKKYRKGKCHGARRGRRPLGGKVYQKSEIPAVTAAFFLKQIAFLRKDGEENVNEPSTSDSAIVYNAVKPKRVCTPRVEDLCFIPEITDGLPLFSDRRNSMAVIDRSPVTSRACGGFRLFTRTFSDKVLAKCFRNPLFDNYEGRRVPKHLRYIHILRQVWLNLSDDERYDWQKLYESFVDTPEADLCRFDVSEKYCLEKAITKQQLYDRMFIQSIDIDKLPCPICELSSPRRFTVPELYVHMNQGHHGAHLYACHFCSKAFLCQDLLREHECEQFRDYLTTTENNDELFTFNYAYVSMVCAECGFHLILSPNCDEELFTSSFINCVLTHNGNSFLIFHVYSAEPLTSDSVRIGFHRILPTTNLHCSYCLEVKSEVDEPLKLFDNAFDLDKHMRMNHKKEATARKCCRCPASFYSVDVYRDHILSHIQDVPLVTLFIDWAPILPPLLERRALVFRMKNRLDFTRFVREDDEEEKDENACVNVRRSVRRKNVELATRDVETESFKYRRAKATWDNYCRILGELSKITDLAWLKSHSEFSLPVVFNGRTVVGNTVNGFILTDNVFECKKCNAVIIGNAKTVEHVAKCCGDEEAAAKLNEKDGLKDYTHLLFDANGRFPFARIRCGYCDTNHCSIVALTKHCALVHSISLRPQKNNLVIQEVADEILQKKWTRTAFDDYLAKEMEKARAASLESSTSPEPDGLENEDSDEEDEDDDGYIRYMSTPLPSTPERLPPSALDQHSPIPPAEEEQISYAVQETEKTQEAENENGTAMKDKESANEKIPEGKPEKVRDKDKFALNQPLWSVNPYRPRPQVQRRYTCFLCCCSYQEISTLNEHLEEHPEHWSRCPMCIQNGVWEKNSCLSFSSITDFFRHMKEFHMNEEKQTVSCKFCDIAVPASSAQGISAIIRHIVYDCRACNACFLCDEWIEEDTSDDVFRRLREHRRQKHDLIFDRLICAACLKGFYSNDVFLRHECDTATIRCVCNPYRRFYSDEGFLAHAAEASSDGRTHKKMVPYVESFAKNRHFVKNEEYIRLGNMKAQERQYYGSVRDTVYTSRIGDSFLLQRPFTLPTVASKDNATKFAQFCASEEGRTIVVNYANEGIMSEAFDVLSTMIDYVHSIIPPMLEEPSIDYSDEPFKRSEELSSVVVARNAQVQIIQEGLKCEYCPFTTLSHSMLVAHRKDEHNDGVEHGIPIDFNLFLCRSCCYAFNKPVEYERHMESHAIPIACKKCSCVSGRDSEFLEHRQNHNTKNAIFACTICSLMYTREVMFMLHMVKKHEMQLAYFCKTCGVCNTNLAAIFDHISYDPCRKLLTIDYIGFVDASQIQFFPNSMLWLHRALNAIQPLKLMDLNPCRHSRCLNSRSEPLVSCYNCNCLTTLNDFKRRSALSVDELKEKVKFELAKDNDTMTLQSILHEFSKPLHEPQITFNVKVENCDPAPRRKEHQRIAPLPSLSMRVQREISNDAQEARPAPQPNIMLSNLKKKFMKRLAEQSAAAAKPVDSTPNVREVKTEVIDVSEAVGSPTTNKDVNKANDNTQNKRSAEVADDPPIKDEPMEVDETVPVAGPSREICLNENELEVLIEEKPNIARKTPARMWNSVNRPVQMFRLDQPSMSTRVNPQSISAEIRKRSAVTLDTRVLTRLSVPMPRSQSNAAPAGAPLAKHYMPAQYSADGADDEPEILELDSVNSNHPKQLPPRVAINRKLNGNYHRIATTSSQPRRVAIYPRAQLRTIHPQPERGTEDRLADMSDELRQMDEEYANATSEIQELLNKPKAGPKKRAAPVNMNIVPPSEKWQRKTRALMDDSDVITDRINHMKFQLSCERYLCVACKAVHVKQSDAVLHQFQDHRVKGLRYSLMCPICRSIFSDLTLFYAHMVTDRRHTKLTFRSDWCNFSFCTKKEAEQHNKEHSMAASQLNMPCGVNCCGICGTAKDYWFARLDNRTFIDHTVFHGFRTSTVCRICSARFDVDKLAFRHYADIHLRDDTSHQANAEEGRKYCRTCRRSLSVDMACDHFDAVHKFVMIEFVPELDNELVIFASRELQCRFNL